MKVARSVVLVASLLVSVAGCQQPRPNSPTTSSTLPSRLSTYQNMARQHGYSFQVADTGLLNTSLSELTGGHKEEFSSVIASRLEKRKKQVARLGEIPSLPNFRITLNTEADDVRPPFDWDHHANDRRFDWRDHRPVTPARRQQSCGACWAFAAAGLTEMFDSVFYKQAIDISEQDILNCTSGGCNGGYISKALDILEQTGATSENILGFSATKGACGSPKRCYHINFHGFVDPNWATPSVPAMKKHIYEWGGVGVYMIATDLMTAYKGGVYDEFATSGDDHFVVIIGWDDDKAHRNGKGAWLIKNSWGSDWGENGFGWVPYEANEIGFNAQILSAAKPPASCQ